MDFAKWLGTLGGGTILALALVGYFAGYWVSGSQYAEMKGERDEWKKLAIEGLTTVEGVKKIRFGQPIPLNDATTPAMVERRLDHAKAIEP